MIQFCKKKLDKCFYVHIKNWKERHKMLIVGSMVLWLILLFSFCLLVFHNFSVKFWADMGEENEAT